MKIASKPWGVFSALYEIACDLDADIHVDTPDETGVTIFSLYRDKQVIASVFASFKGTALRADKLILKTPIGTSEHESHVSLAKALENDLNSAMEKRML